MFVWIECPVCTSHYTVHLQEVMLQRQGRQTKQIFCMSCQSFFHTSNYREDSGTLYGDAQFLQGHIDPSAPAIVNYLIDNLSAGEVYEAGCGVGHVLAHIAASGFVARGIDPNPEAIRLAETKGINVSCGYFHSLADPVDAIICLDVLEHLASPRAFVRDLVASVKSGGIIIVRVPEVAEHQWHWLKGADADCGFDEADPFRDNSVHIIHFSPQGSRGMCESLGATFQCALPGDLRVFRT